jgi:7,8-dihydropterin-6-yl-methyl-4-(beta-D-ribofuranosyl)aminobenzene 5'-phosphate synthase
MDDISGGCMRIRTLIENHPHPDREDLAAEHGLSFYIEVNDHVYLSDVGQSGKFAENAGKLGLDLSRVEALAISHHHYDHGGGLRRFFEENDLARVYLRQTDTEDFVANSPPDPLRYIGLDKGLLKEHHARIEMITENQEAAPGLHLLTTIPDSYPKPDGDLRLQMLSDEGLRPDDFKHELVTVLADEKGLVVLSGCAHNGVLNMIAAVREAFPDETIQAVIGGFHLHHEDREAILAVGEKLLAEEIPAIISGHCTGDKAVKLLENCLGERFQQLYTGMHLSF